MGFLRGAEVPHRVLCSKQLIHKSGPGAAPWATCWPLCRRVSPFLAIVYWFYNLENQPLILRVRLENLVTTEASRASFLSFRTLPPLSRGDCFSSNEIATAHASTWFPASGYASWVPASHSSYHHLLYPTQVPPSSPWVLVLLSSDHPLGLG